MLQPVGVLAVTAIGGSSAGLDIGGIPGFRPDGAQESGGVEGARAHFHVDRLQNHAAVISPEFLQGQDQALEGFDIPDAVVRCLVCHDDCLLLDL